MLTHLELIFIGLQVKKVTFNSGSSEFGTGGEWFINMQVKESFRDMDSSSFIIEFVITLTNNATNFNVNVIANGLFKTNVEIDDVFKKSMFIKANAPAIAFPYLRTFVSNLILNAGYHPVILPSYNFLKMAEERQLKDENLEKEKSEEL